MALEWELRRVFVWDSGTRVDRNVLMRQGQALSVSLRRTLYGRSFSLNSLFVPLGVLKFWREIFCLILRRDGFV